VLTARGTEFDAGVSVMFGDAAGKDWLTTYARTVNGKSVLDVGGKERTLPQADLGQLIRDASSS
jgi:hypothetical protein